MSVCVTEAETLGHVVVGIVWQSRSCPRVHGGVVPALEVGKGVAVCCIAFAAASGTGRLQAAFKLGHRQGAFLPAGREHDEYHGQFLSFDQVTAAKPG